MSQKVDLAAAERRSVELENLTPVPIERMKTLPIFAGIAESTLKKLQPNVLAVTFEPEETILRQGDYSDAAFFIVDGVVQVILDDATLPTYPGAAAAKKPPKEPEAKPKTKGPDAMAGRAKSLLERAAGDANGGCSRRQR